MLHDVGEITELPCDECPKTLSEEGRQIVDVFLRSAAVESYEKAGVKKRHVTIDWALVSLLLEEEEDRAQIIRDIADIRHDLSS